MRNKHKIRAAAWTVCGAAMLGLAGCGGGGGDGPTTTTPPPATGDGGSGGGGNVVSGSAFEGFWRGTWFDKSSFSTITVELIGMDDGTLWGINSNIVNGNYNVLGMLYGADTTSSGSNGVTASFTQFDFTSNAPNEQHTFSGQVLVPKDTLDLALDGGLTYFFDYLTDYDQALSLSAVAGRYSGFWGVSGYANTAQDGIIIAGSNLTVPADASGCSISGTLAPHQTSHGTVGVLDVKLTFNGASCALGNGATTQGIAVQISDKNGIGILTTTADRKNGVAILGLRQ